MKKFVIAMSFLLTGCMATSGSINTYEGNLSLQAKKELTLFGMKSIGLNVGIGDVKRVLSTSEVFEMVKAGLNAKGLLCADIVGVVSVEEGAYGVSCVAYRSGGSKTEYMVWAYTGDAYIP